MAKRNTRGFHDHDRDGFARLVTKVNRILRLVEKQRMAHEEITASLGRIRASIGKLRTDIQELKKGIVPGMTNEQAADLRDQADALANDLEGLDAETPETLPRPEEVEGDPNAPVTGRRGR